MCVCVRENFLCVLEQGSEIVVEKRQRQLQKKRTKWSRQFHVTRYTCQCILKCKFQCVFFFIHNFPTERTTSMWLYLFHLNIVRKAAARLLTLSSEFDKENETENRCKYNVILNHLILWIGTQYNKEKRERIDMHNNPCIMYTVYDQ